MKKDKNRLLRFARNDKALQEFKGDARIAAIVQMIANIVRDTRCSDPAVFFSNHALSLRAKRPNQNCRLLNLKFLENQQGNICRKLYYY